MLTLDSEYRARPDSMNLGDYLSSARPVPLSTLTERFKAVHGDGRVSVVAIGATPPVRQLWGELQENGVVGKGDRLTVVSEEEPAKGDFRLMRWRNPQDRQRMTGRTFDIVLADFGKPNDITPIQRLARHASLSLVHLSNPLGSADFEKSMGDVGSERPIFIRTRNAGLFTPLSLLRKG